MSERSSERSWFFILFWAVFPPLLAILFLLIEFGLFAVCAALVSHGPYLPVWFLNMVEVAAIGSSAVLALAACRRAFRSVRPATDAEYPFVLALSGFAAGFLAAVVRDSVIWSPYLVLPLIVSGIWLLLLLARRGMTAPDRAIVPPGVHAGW